MRSFALALMMTCVLACGADDEPTLPSCVEVSASSCSPEYAPTWTNVYSRTLMPSCAPEGSACHANSGSEGAKANGLEFGDPDVAYDRLLGHVGSMTFVEPGDAACSLLTVRLAVDDAELVMPPGSPLSAGKLCSIVQWIEAGAAKD